jgi:hypothetical protein
MRRHFIPLIAAMFVIIMVLSTSSAIPIPQVPIKPIIPIQTPDSWKIGKIPIPTEPLPEGPWIPEYIYFTDGGELPGNIYDYNTASGVESTYYTDVGVYDPIEQIYVTPPKTIHSFTFSPEDGNLYYVYKNDYHIYQRQKTESGWSPEAIVYTHNHFIADIAFAYDNMGQLGLYFSDCFGTQPTGEIYKIEDGSAKLYYEVNLGAVGSLWSGDFTFDDTGALYLCSGSVGPNSSIYKVEGGTVETIYTDDELKKGLLYLNSTLFYSDWNTTIYALNPNILVRVPIYSNPTRTSLWDVGWRVTGTIYYIGHNQTVHNP